MKSYGKYILGGAIIALLGIYIFFTNQNAAPATTNSGGTPPTGTTGSDSSTPAGSPPDGTGGTGTTTTPSPIPATPTSAYKDGVYTGPVTDAIYGNLQIAVVVKGGAITDVMWPVYPDAPGHTSEVSQQSLPELKREAIASQSAKVDIVSGATQTSEAFQQSLASALAQAK